MRNSVLSNSPAPLQPQHEECSPAELIEQVTVVIGVKDTCSQTSLLMAYMASLLPRGIHVIFTYPDFIGCRDLSVPIELFDHLDIVKTPAEASPIAGFLQARPYISTPYALLMHNDAYPMEHFAVCELFRALAAHPESAFSVPQIYERGEKGVTVPHGHHRHLHLRPNGMSMDISYDIDFDLLTRRLPSDYTGEGPQIDFMEDHAYMGRTETYHLYLDARASFTLEYIDNVLAMRSNDTFPWYVPTARFVFDVDTNKVGWNDIPYFVHKRSEEVGLQVRGYLSVKWNVSFPDTGIWNYVRYATLFDAVLDDTNLPSAWNQQAALYYSWFQSIGFNRYNDKPLIELLHLPLLPTGMVTIHRDITPPTWEAPSVTNTAHSILPVSDHHKLINITLKSSRIPISLNVTGSCNPSFCGMLVVQSGVCHCYSYISPFNKAGSTAVAHAMDLCKLPSRILKFVQMKYTQRDNLCMGACTMQVPAFKPTDKVVRWRWFADNVGH